MILISLPEKKDAIDNTNSMYKIYNFCLRGVSCKVDMKWILLHFYYSNSEKKEWI